MRDILFRGKCVDTGMWYEGGYIHLHKTTHCPIGDPERFPDNDIHQIVFERMTDWELPNQHYRVDVDPKTVGQFTGLTDKNGKKIFEGDITAFACNDGTKHFSVVKYGIFNCSCCYGVYGWFLDGECGDIRDFDPDNGMVDRITVEGNIYDNPELLEAKFVTSCD